MLEQGQVQPELLLQGGVLLDARTLHHSLGAAKGWEALAGMEPFLLQSRRHSWDHHCHKVAKLLVLVAFPAGKVVAGTVAKWAADPAVMMASAAAAAAAAAAEMSSGAAVVAALASRMFGGHHHFPVTMTTAQPW